MVPSNRVKSEQGHTSDKGKGQTKSMDKAPMCLRCGRNSHTKYYCRDHKSFLQTLQEPDACLSLLCISFLKPHLPQMVRHPTLLAPADKASKHTCQVPPTSRRSPRTRRGKKREHTQKSKAQQNDSGACTAPHQVNRNAQPPPQGQQQHFYPTTPTTSTPAWSDCGPTRPCHCCCDQTDGSITSATLQGQPNSDKSP